MDSSIPLIFCGLVIALASASPLGVNPCTKEREQILSQNGPPGTFVPTCTKNGWYDYRQCSGSSGYCWCAFPDTGTKLTGTDIPPSSNQALVCPKCLVDQAEALPPAGAVGAYAPRCSAQGKFKPLQSHGSTGYRWCVDENTGKEVDGTRTPPGSNKKLPCEN